MQQEDALHADFQRKKSVRSTRLTQLNLLRIFLTRHVDDTRKFTRSFPRLVVVSSTTSIVRGPTTSSTSQSSRFQRHEEQLQDSRTPRSTYNWDPRAFVSLLAEAVNAEMFFGIFPRQKFFEPVLEKLRLEVAFLSSGIQKAQEKMSSSGIVQESSRPGSSSTKLQTLSLDRLVAFRDLLSCVRARLQSVEDSATQITSSKISVRSGDVVRGRGLDKSAHLHPDHDKPTVIASRRTTSSKSELNVQAEKLKMDALASSLWDSEFDDFIAPARISYGGESLDSVVLRIFHRLSAVDNSRKKDADTSGTTRGSPGSSISHLFGRRFVVMGVGPAGVEHYARHLKQFYDWSGVLLDAGFSHPRIDYFTEFVTPQNVGYLLGEKYGRVIFGPTPTQNENDEPPRLDLLAILIEGSEWHVLKALLADPRKFLHPRVVVSNHIHGFMLWNLIDETLVRDILFSILNDLVVDHHVPWNLTLVPRLEVFRENRRKKMDEEEQQTAPGAVQHDYRKLYGPSVRALQRLLGSFGYALVYVGFYTAIFVLRSEWSASQQVGDHDGAPNYALKNKLRRLAQHGTEEDVLRLCHRFQKTQRLDRMLPHIAGLDMCSDVKNVVGYSRKEFRDHFLSPAEVEAELFHLSKVTSHLVNDSRVIHHVEEDVILSLSGLR
ncbi:unnamed protein product [Amoebophrya sp. A25]|nr:unnamed protein product [Amoebophrya sp. A25]|eukprot:GSA25T00012230001.1